MNGAKAVGAEAGGWSECAPAELSHHIGTIGRVRTIEGSAERIALLRNAVSRITRRAESGRDADLAEICPDPLVFALESGLPRVRLLDRVIDGGSEWQLLGASVPTSLTVVSRITEIVERTSSTGRRMIRCCYENEFRSSRGELIGWTRGYSLDVEVTR
jgi:hypothetical protein